jgi:hypothetical protein
MANAAHTDLLRSGLAEWNRGRKKKPKGVPDLHKSNFSNADLRMMNLKGV